MSTIKKDIYILGQSETKTIENCGEEIRLDLSLQPQPLLETGTVTGTVTSNSNPLPNALVKVFDSNYEPIIHGITNSQGVYTISNVPAGNNYNIFATANGKNLEQGTSFNLTPSQVVIRDFNLVDNPKSKLGLIAGDLIDSLTYDPINGAVISLYSIDPNTNDETLVAITYTNEYGQFIFSELPIANYSVKITALGYIPKDIDANITEPGEIVPILASIDEDTNTSRCTVSGIITDNLNNTISNADVVLYKVNTNDSLTPIAFTKTGNNGVYLFINVPQGKYKVKSNQTTDVTV